MFNNVGPKIKTVGKIFFWIQVAICIILGIIFLDSGRTEDIAPFVIIGGPIFAYVSCLLIVGFGELIESTHKTITLLEGEKKVTPNNNFNANDIYVTPTPMPQPKPQPEPFSSIPSKYCPMCGCKQNADRVICQQCGASFE